METIIAIAVLVLIVGLALWYVIRAKKHGQKCIGCPNGCRTTNAAEPTCSGNCGCCTHCPSQDNA